MKSEKVKGIERATGLVGAGRARMKSFTILTHGENSPRESKGLRVVKMLSAETRGAGQKIGGGITASEVMRVGGVIGSWRGDGRRVPKMVTAENKVVEAKTKEPAARARTYAEMVAEEEIVKPIEKQNEVEREIVAQMMERAQEPKGMTEKEERLAEYLGAAEEMRAVIPELPMPEEGACEVRRNRRKRKGNRKASTSEEGAVEA